MNRRSSTRPAVRFALVAALFVLVGVAVSHQSNETLISHAQGRNRRISPPVSGKHPVTGNTETPPPRTPTPAPFDLVWDSEDDNGLPLNAKWGWQITNPGSFPDPTQCTDGPFSPQCTHWGPTTEIGNICADHGDKMYGVAGHENWAPGTYVGRITWETKSSEGTDDDYNLDLFPADAAGLTVVRDNLEVEFDSDETIDHFNTPWWNAFHNAVDGYRSDDEVNQLWFKEPNGTMGRYAIVTGLIGLDLAHDGHTELHPAWAMAIRVKDDDPNDEVWAMFIRRLGNEGFCSSGDQHPLGELPNDTYTFRLPWRPGASSVKAATGTTFLAKDSGASGPAVQSAPNQGVLVSFTLSTSNRINGELHLQWPGGQGPAPIPNTCCWAYPPVTEAQCEKNCIAGDCFDFKNGNQTIYKRCLANCKQECQPQPGRAPVRAFQGPEPEKRVASLLAKATPAQRSQLLALNPWPPVSHDAQALRVGAVNRIQSLPRRPARARSVQLRSIPDPEKRARDQRILDFLHRNFGKR